MKILELTHLLPWPPVDGGKKGIIGFVEGYRRHPRVSGHRLLSMCPVQQMDWAREWHPEGSAPRFDFFDTRNRVLPFLANALFSSQPFNMAKYQRESFANLVREEIAREMPDVVHFDGSHTAYYAPLVRQLAPSALRILRCHNAEYVILERLATTLQNPVKARLIAEQAARLKRYEAAELRNFDLIMAITDIDAERFLALDPSVSDRIMVLPAGAQIPPALPPLPAKSGTLRLVHIAMMDWIPNQDGLDWMLGEVLTKLDQAGLDYHLDVVGRNMPERFRRLAKSRVTVHGFVRDLSPITENADLAVVPLHAGGGMRVKILDYWSLGIPVVSTRIGAEGLGGDASSEVLALGDTPDDFAAQITRLGRDDGARAAMRAKAFDLVSANYGWPALIDRIIDRVEALREERRDR